MRKTQIDIVTDTSASDRQIITDGLNAYNSLHVPADDYSPLCVFARSECGEIIGGLLGETFWGWFHIELLWIDEDCRSQA